MARFLLTVDTTAPVVTWGEATGAVAGAGFSIPYTLDEPTAQIASATLTLADARELALTDNGSSLAVALPPDTPEGNATVTANVTDDVGNTAQRTHVVYLTGAVVVPEEPTVTPASGRPKRRSYRSVRSVSTGVLRADRTLRTIAARGSTAALTGTTSLRRVAGTRGVALRSALNASSTGLARARLTTGANLLASTTTGIAHRAEGPRTEEEIVSLLLVD